VGQGVHEELLEGNTIYQRLYHRQWAQTASTRGAEVT
jgi:ABC-type multidrug transport system fused ATPase/permease subunit